MMRTSAVPAVLGLLLLQLYACSATISIQSGASRDPKAMFLQYIQNSELQAIQARGVSIDINLPQAAATPQAYGIASGMTSGNFLSQVNDPVRAGDQTGLWNSATALVISTGDVANIATGDPSTDFPPFAGSFNSGPNEDGSAGDSISMEMKITCPSKIENCNQGSSVVTYDLVFQYIFASKELPAFGGDAYNDKFYMKMNGINRASLSKGRGGYSTATIRGNDVAINTITPCKFEGCTTQGGWKNDYFVKNYYPRSDKENSPYVPLGDFFQFPGFTKSLTFNYSIDCSQPGKLNVLNLTVEDIADGVYDSAVFIDASSVVLESRCQPVVNPETWGTCSASCGPGVETSNLGNTRNCIIRECRCVPSYGPCQGQAGLGACCPQVQDPFTGSFSPQACGLQFDTQCGGGSRSCPLPACPDNWGQCNGVNGATCGQGIQIDNNNPTRSRPCQLPACEVFGQCSVTCGTGVMLSNLGNSQPCYNQPCDVCGFVPSGWGACVPTGSITCGTQGRMTRSVQCTCNGAAVEEYRCTDPRYGTVSVKPATTQSCPLPVCAGYFEGPWSACSITCSSPLAQSGLMQRQVTCMRNGIAVPDGLCSGARPASVQTCNVDACPVYMYKEGAWSECISPTFTTPSTTAGQGVRTGAVMCGPGTQTRTLECVDQATGQPANTIDQFGIVRDACFGLPRPPSSQGCSNTPCGICDYYVGSWGDCSTTCDSPGLLGTMKREVYCQDRNESRMEDESCCKTQMVEDGGAFNNQNLREPRMIPLPRPQETSRCPQVPCPEYSWSQDDWSACSVTCGSGVKTRSVFCLLDDTKVGDEMCDGVLSRSGGADGRPTKPADREACQLQNCMCKRFVMEEWSGCSASCGPGTQKRKPYCEEYPCNARQGQDYYVRRFTDPQEVQVECREVIPTDEEETKEEKDCEFQACGQFNFRMKTVGQCSATCGNSFRNQEPECIDTAQNTTVEMANCLLAGMEVPEPGTVKCDVPKCPTYQWRPEAWGFCSVTCGSGTYSRNVPCLDDKGEQSQKLGCAYNVRDGFVNYEPREQCECDIANRPALTETCHAQVDCEQVVLEASPWCTRNPNPCYADYNRDSYTRTASCRKLDFQNTLVDDALCGNPQRSMGCDEDLVKEKICGCCPRTQSPTAVPTAIPTIAPSDGPTLPPSKARCEDEINQFKREDSDKAFCANMGSPSEVRWTGTETGQDGTQMCDRECENNMIDMHSKYKCCWKYIVMDFYTLDETAVVSMFDACALRRNVGDEFLDPNCFITQPPRQPVFIPTPPVFLPPREVIIPAPVFPTPVVSTPGQWQPVWTPIVPNVIPTPQVFFPPPVFLPPAPVMRPSPSNRVPTNTRPCSDILTALGSYGQLSTMVSYLRQPNGVLATAQSANSFTLFAPVNSALSGVQIPPGVGTVEYIGRVLRDHIGNVAKAAVSFGIADSTFTNLNGTPLQTSSRGLGGATNVYQVCMSGGGCATVTTQDVTVCNGIVHIIDSVLS